MNIVEHSKIELSLAIKYNEIIDYLEGEGSYIVLSDPQNMDSEHAYGFCVQVYNGYHSEHRELKLDDKFYISILDKLKAENCSYVDVYRIYNCVTAQLLLEKKGLSTFKIPEDKKMEIFVLLREKVLAFSSQLKRCKSFDGDLYNDGVLEKMQIEDKKLYSETGHKIL